MMNNVEKLTIVKVSASIISIAILCYLINDMSMQSQPFSLKDAGYNETNKTQIVERIPEDLQGEKFPSKLTRPKDRVNVAGEAFIRVNVHLIEKELESNTGWVVNDSFISIPRYLDNKVNFQMGVRSVYLRSILTLRENLSRQDRTTSIIEPHVARAYELASNEPYSWWFPAYEDKLKESILSLNEYHSALINNKSGFYPRADTLVKLNNQYSSLLGSIANSLMANDISFMDDDDRFYVAKGVVYAMYENYLAVKYDFSETLNKNDSGKLLESITEILKNAYFEPLIVLSGDKDSLRSNHLRNLVSSIYSARQKINSMNSVLLHRGDSSSG